MVAKSGKKKRKLNSKTVRQMLHWAHYRFKQTLKFHGLKRGTTVIDVSEEYTSKTCTKCGHVHQNLGGSKHFKCPHCGHSIPRDWNGALGIFLKALGDTANVDGCAVTLLWIVLHTFTWNCRAWCICVKTWFSMVYVGPGYFKTYLLGQNIHWMTIT